jgi:1,4-dihydroxy-2-naphthoate polyprenyltransferase
MMAGFYVSLAVLVGFRALPVYTIIAFAGLPRLFQVWKEYSRPRPEEPPRGYPLWPLWYAPAAFVHSRRAGALLLVGLVISAIAGTV